ncbi:activating signal cointegrator 1 complex subunit 2, partial [Hyposmocoma kahamanoa]|uniref:activating signal cointegrator 1 complex subunit 2 n=1 Tax=Hyposmocoma kahamanoa TaxID=1477025 RepID=UPI000E6D6E27
TFKYIILQVNKDYDSEEPPNLPETFEGFSEIPRPSNSETDKQESLTIDTLRDLVMHMLDTAMTLRLFIEVYSKAVEIYRKTNFVTSIVQLYEYGIPPLYEKLQELNDSSPECAEIEVFIDSARAELIDIFREILAVYKNNIFNGEGNISQHVESYLTILLEGFTERLLVRDYNVCYPLHEDIEMLKQAYPEIDVVKTSFILRAINTNLSDSSSETSDDVPNGPVDITEQKRETPGTYNNTPGPSANTQDAQIPHQVREQSLISEVRDILPELGDGFILKCLQYYDFKVDKVINSYLEDNLAEPLRELDKSLPIIPEDPLDVKFLETGVERLNVFDGDAFDIMSRDDIDTSKVHIGKKKSKYKDAKDLLDDKSELQKIRERYNKYNLICAEEDALYDDEYDDTYDSDGMGPTTDTIDELEDRPFQTPRVLLRRGGRAEEECESSSEEEEQPSTSISTPNTSYKNRVDFCVNPALMRARREATQQTRKENRAPPPPRKKDVVGKPKGQGQEKEVLQNRNRKEQNKSSRANHNRRQGAQWKRSQGMMPS